MSTVHVALHNDCPVSAPASYTSKTCLLRPPLGRKKLVLVRRWSLYRGQNNCTSTIIGTRPSGLYREVVPGYKWSSLHIVTASSIPVSGSVSQSTCLGSLWGTWRRAVWRRVSGLECCHPCSSGAPAISAAQGAATPRHTHTHTQTDSDTHSDTHTHTDSEYEYNPQCIVYHE